MKTLKRIIILIFCGIGAYVIIINNIPHKANQEINKPDSLRIEVKKRYDEKGQLKADVEILNGVNHGIAHNYYPNGTVHSEISYKNGLKEGNSIWYYENGKPYRITPFVENKMHGIQQKFYNSGKLMAEVPYIKDSIIEGTKEFSESGKLMDEKLPFQIKRIPSDDNNRAFIEITTKKIDVIEEAFIKYTFQGKTMMGKASREGKQLIIPIQIKGNKVPDVTVIITYKTKMNNLKVVTSILN